MSHADLDLVVTELTANESGRILPHSLAVMIEVPAIKQRPATKRSPGTISRGVRTAGRQPRPSRRRLRRDVCLAGCTLLALVPIVSACTLGWSSRPDRIVACSIPEPLQTESTTDRGGFTGRLPVAQEDSPVAQAAIASRGNVIFSSEPSVIAPGSAGEPPVIFPGYVLPDDSREDVLHEGS
jgi:hypothetical protein